MSAYVFRPVAFLGRLGFGLFAVGLVLGVTGAPGASAAEHLAAAPYRIFETGWVTVDVTVNGRGPYPFIIDTGATRSIVFTTLAEEQEFPPAGGPLQRVLGTESSGFYPAHTVGELAVGGARLNNLKTVILNDWRPGEGAPMGVLGLDFLGQFLIVADAGRRELRFYAQGARPPRVRGGWRTVSLERDDFGLQAGALFIISARVNRRPVELLLDLGATAPVVNQAAFLNITSGGFSLNNRRGTREDAARITDAMQTSVSGVPIVFGDLRADRVVWRNEIFLIRDTEFFREIGRIDRPFGLFSVNLLSSGSFALDLSNDRLLISRRRDGRLDAENRQRELERLRNQQGIIVNPLRP